MSEVGASRRQPSAARAYDNSGRRERAAGTRRRIVDAAAELLRGASIREWDTITIRAVAEEAGVHERTVYRHFGTERALRDAVMVRFEESAGVDLDALGLDDLAETAASVLRFASVFPSSPSAELDPTLHDADQRRREALLRAVGERAERWSDAERVRAAALLDLMWNFSSFERLRSGWGLSEDEAIDTVRWGVELIATAAEAAAHAEGASRSATTAGSAER